MIFRIMNESYSKVVEGIHYQTGERIALYFQNGLISEIKILSEPNEGITNMDVSRDQEKEELPLIGPGLVDLQINGFQGHDFNHPGLTPDTVARITRLLRLEGVTTYYPTLITESAAHVENALRAIATACREDQEVASMIGGIHLEGPYISPMDGARGAHDARWVRKPDWEEFMQWQQAAEGRIKLITLSPEWENADDFIRKCVAEGVTVSIGHTAASSTQIRSAAAAGASLSTHFGNGIAARLPRHPNVLWDQLAQDELSTCLIADGFHLPEEVLKVVMKVKGDQAMLVSDAVALCGMPQGAYHTPVGGKVVLTAEGRLHLAESPELLAGSAQLLTRGMEHLTKSGICSLHTAWDMASLRPSALMNLKTVQGIQVGAPADMMLASWDGESFRVLRAYKSGKCSE